MGTWARQCARAFLVHLCGPAGPSEKCRPGTTTPSGHPAPYHPHPMVSHGICNKTQLLSEPHALGDLGPAVPRLCSPLSPTVPFLPSVLRAMAAAQWGLSWGPALSRRPPSHPRIHQARHQPGAPANHLPLPGITPTVSTFAVRQLRGNKVHVLFPLAHVSPRAGPWHDSSGRLQTSTDERAGPL